MARHRFGAKLCLLAVVVCGLVAVHAGAEDVALAPSKSSFERWAEQVKNPADWFNWGADLRLRQVYTKNVVDLLSSMDDTWNFFRIRGRVWFTLGPFFVDKGLGKPNGIKVYPRITAEPRPFTQRASASTPFRKPAVVWDEAILDNFYLDWQRIGGYPVSLRVGRQDMPYGRGFVLLDGTPLDGSRTIYVDGAKATIHVDELNATLDLLALDNSGDENRVNPISDEDALVSEFNNNIFGAYFIKKPSAPGQPEWHAYYIYKDEDPIVPVSMPGKVSRVVHTWGGLIQGRNGPWDYYLEAAYQRGNEARIRREGFGLSSDLGYTFKEARCTPRVHAGYSWLSGDDPNTKTYEGWDPVLARWPQFSELYVYRWAWERALPGCYCNLHRFTAGLSAVPYKDPKRGRKLTASFDYHLLLADEHSNGKAFPYSSGDTRGQLFVGILKFNLNKWISSHLWAEYFIPSTYYDKATDDAAFLRWQVIFKF